jgi:ribosomal subunit interface protein
MISKLEINGVHIKIDDKLRTYITKKIGKLDRFIPRHARESAHAEVFIKEINVQGKPKGSKQSSRGRVGAKEYTCEVVLRLPKETITLNESTMNAFAAVDIVEVKLKNQIKKYKETHNSIRLHRRVLSRLRRRGA